MGTCTYCNEIEAYHDGELEGARREVVEAHLRECAECAALLEELQGVSRALAGVVRPGLSEMSRQRLVGRIDQVMEGGLMRTAWMLSGLAASVLVAGSLWLANVQDTPQAAPPWVEVAASTSLGRDTATPAAEWYLAGAFSRVDDTP